MSFGKLIEGLGSNIENAGKKLKKNAAALALVTAASGAVMTTTHDVQATLQGFTTPELTNLPDGIPTHARSVGGNTEVFVALEDSISHKFQINKATTLNGINYTVTPYPAANIGAQTTDVYTFVICNNGKDAYRATYDGSLEVSKSFNEQAPIWTPAPKDMGYVTSIACANDSGSKLFLATEDFINAQGALRVQTVSTDTFNDLKALPISVNTTGSIISLSYSDNTLSFTQEDVPGGTSTPYAVDINPNTLQPIGAIKDWNLLGNGGQVFSPGDDILNVFTSPLINLMNKEGILYKLPLYQTSSSTSSSSSSSVSSSASSSASSASSSSGSSSSSSGMGGAGGMENTTATTGAGGAGGMEGTATTGASGTGGVENTTATTGAGGMEGTTSSTGTGMDNPIQIDKDCFATFSDISEKTWKSLTCNDKFFKGVPILNVNIDFAGKHEVVEILKGFESQGGTIKVDNVSFKVTADIEKGIIITASEQEDGIKRFSHYLAGEISGAEGTKLKFFTPEIKSLNPNLDKQVIDIVAFQTLEKSQILYDPASCKSEDLKNCTPREFNSGTGRIPEGTIIYKRLADGFMTSDPKEFEKVPVTPVTAKNPNCGCSIEDINNNTPNWIIFSTAAALALALSRKRNRFISIDSGSGTNNLSDKVNDALLRKEADNDRRITA